MGREPFSAAILDLRPNSHGQGAPALNCRWHWQCMPGATRRRVLVRRPFQTRHMSLYLFGGGHPPFLVVSWKPRDPHMYKVSFGSFWDRDRQAALLILQFGSVWFFFCSTEYLKLGSRHGLGSFFEQMRESSDRTCGLARFNFKLWML